MLNSFSAFSWAQNAPEESNEIVQFQRIFILPHQCSTLTSLLICPLGNQFYFFGCPCVFLVAHLSKVLLPISTHKKLAKKNTQLYFILCKLCKCQILFAHKVLQVVLNSFISFSWICEFIFLGTLPIGVASGFSLAQSSLE